jgi:arsenite methyltransferase
VGLVHVEVIDGGRDLNADARVEDRSGCCSPPASLLPIAEVGCCPPSVETIDPLRADFHGRLKDWPPLHDGIGYAASVRAFAVKP